MNIVNTVNTVNRYPFPVLLSIPHGGNEMPEELKGRVCIDPFDLFDDSDAFTREIYSLGDRVEVEISASTARAFVDLSRSVEDMPPGNPDGLIKSKTCYGKPIYIEGKEPDTPLVERLISRYYEPYHRKIRERLHNEKFSLALDCHSMAAVGPAIAPDTGEARPLICLGNVRGQSASPETAARLADCFRTAFSLRESDVTVNRPFAGGYITRTYGNNPVPWVQVELNRSLYLSEPWFERSALRMDHNRLKELNAMFEKALELFFSKK